MKDTSPADLLACPEAPAGFPLDAEAQMPDGVRSAAISLADDVRDTYAEAKSTGFDVKTIRAVIKLRRMEKHHRDEAEMLLDTYKQALGI